jgi:hypothetical protein
VRGQAFSELEGACGRLVALLFDCCGTDFDFVLGE